MAQGTEKEMQEFNMAVARLAVITHGMQPQVSFAALCTALAVNLMRTKRGKPHAMRMAQEATKFICKDIDENWERRDQSIAAFDSYGEELRRDHGTGMAEEEGAAPSSGVAATSEGGKRQGGPERGPVGGKRAEGAKDAGEEQS